MYHIVVSKDVLEIVNTEVRKRNRGSSIRHTQQSVADEIIKEWKENKK